uniref:RNA-directed RNA polymerase n=1 Tax=Uromyces fabae virus TaxID=3069272 RepID=A0AA51U957_9VIRU|nr:putative RNA-dependent RNA polymerase [Uromyces fabae virus]
MVGCSRAQSHYSLLEVRPNVRWNGSMWVTFGDKAVRVYALYLNKLKVSALYLHADHKFINRDAYFMKCVSRIQYGPSLFPYNLQFDRDVLDNVWQTVKYNIKPDGKSIKYINDVLSGIHRVKVSKVSSRHLRHVTWRELASIGNQVIFSKAGFVFNHLLLYANDPFMTEAYFCGLILWVLNLQDETYQYVSRSQIWDTKYKTLPEFLSYIKATITLKLKALQNIVSIDLAQCFEFEVLINRGVGDIDWEKETSNRTTPDLCNLDANIIYARAFELLSTVKSRGSKPTVRRWDNFWSTRWKWAPAGSYYSQFEEDDQFRARESTLRNKIFSLCAMGKKEFEHFNSRIPQLRAKAMTKYEWGKQRAIYSVDNTSFILGQYSMGDCEVVLSKMFPIGPSANETQVREDVGELLKNGIPYCFDFEDFNSQHSTLSMQMILSAYRDVFAPNLDPMQVEAINWQIAALEDVSVLNPDGSTYACGGTLLSGWRLTTFMNTLLNKIYISECLPNQTIVSLHNGDDVLAAVQSMSQVNLLMKNAELFNIRFQPTKCFLGAIAEFLRVDHNTGNGRQYLARAISTYVHAPTESIIPNDLLAVLRSQQSRLTEVIDRGGNIEIMTRICAAQTRFIQKIWNVRPADIDIIRKTHVSLGGINDTIELNSLQHRVSRISTYRQFDPGGKLAEDMRRPLPGVQDYALYLANKFDLHPYLDKLTHSIRKSIFATTLLNKFSVEIEPINSRLDDQIIVEANQYRMFKGIADNTKTMLAKAFNIPLFEFSKGMSHIVESLRWQHDPLRTLNLWT